MFEKIMELRQTLLVLFLIWMTVFGVKMDKVKLLWYANNWKKIILNDTSSNCIGLFYNIIERFGVIFIFERI